MRSKLRRGVHPCRAGADTASRTSAHTGAGTDAVLWRQHAVRPLAVAVLLVLRNGLQLRHVAVAVVVVQANTSGRPRTKRVRVPDATAGTADAAANTRGRVRQVR
jgi:hypothetical protein